MRRRKGLRCHRERSEIWAWLFSPVVQRFPRRGGNYNNGGNIGLGYENCNNPRGSANRNYGARPRSRRQKKALHGYAPAADKQDGRGSFPSGQKCPVNEKPTAAWRKSPLRSASLRSARKGGRQGLRAAYPADRHCPPERKDNLSRAETPRAA